jgi:hypothetical protein
MGDVVLCKDLVDGEIAPWSIVLVQRMYRHVVGSGACRARDRFAKFAMRVIANPDPIDGAEDDRLTGAHDHYATATQRSLDLLSRVVRQRAADGWGGVDVENADAEGVVGGLRLQGMDRQEHRSGEDCAEEDWGSRHGVVSGCLVSGEEVV